MKWAEALATKFAKGGMDKVACEMDSAEKVWTALGDRAQVRNSSQWWYAFVDGWAHAGGQGVFEGTAMSLWAGQNGKFLAPIEEVYQRFSRKEELERGWTVDRIVQLNVGLRDTTCKRPPCLGEFTDFLPRGATASNTSGGLPIDGGPVHDLLGGTVGASFGTSLHDKQQHKRRLLGEALVNYSRTLAGATIDVAAWANPRRALGGALRPLATLYAGALPDNHHTAIRATAPPLDTLLSLCPRSPCPLSVCPLSVCPLSVGSHGGDPSFSGRQRPHT